MAASFKVYAGLSLSEVEVRSVVPEAVVAPPVERDDVLADIEDEVSGILILDGRFHQSLSVSPSEIMDALRRGIRVYGASSMGALRAAELEPYGMVGCGAIFRHIRDQAAFRDDFLGQVFAPERSGIQLASVTYLELELALRGLLERGRIAPAAGSRLCELYRDLHYTERDLPTLVAALRRLDAEPEPLIQAARLAFAELKRAKREDALEALMLARDQRDAVAGLNSELGPSRRRARNSGRRGALIPPSIGMGSELGAPCPASDLIAPLTRSQPVVFRQNGNRAVRASDVLRRLRRIAPLVGVTRVADVSRLADHRLPVFQSTRPAPWGHTHAGTTTGSQGKGRTSTQATVSCLVEAVEGYCLEPKSVQLVRASYDFLRKRHAVADPRQFAPALGVRRARVREPLMWTEALSLEHGQGVLIPAELVYFPFFALDYRTRPVFPTSTSGAGAGSSYLEAVIHALYECIECHYGGAVEKGRLALRPLQVERIAALGRDPRRALGRGAEVQLYTALFRRRRDLPYLACYVYRDDLSFYGTACCASVGMAMDRAVTEALQSMSLTYSGSREDLDGQYGDDPCVEAPVIGSPLRERAYRSRVFDRDFQDLRDELRFILAWLDEMGFPSRYVVNLTRRGIDFPVVRAVVPGMMAEREVSMPTDYRSADTLRHCYG